MKIFTFMIKRSITSFKIYAFFILSILGLNANATVELSLSASSNLSSVNTGNQFIYTLNYQVSSLTVNGINVRANIALPTNLVPFVISPFANSVEFDESQVASVTYNSGTNEIDIVFVNPIPAGSTGQLQIKFKYLNGVTPNTYAPDLVATIDADNNLNIGGGTGPVSSNILNVTAIANNQFTINKNKTAGGAIDDLTIFQIGISSSSSSSAALHLSNPVLVDTLPIGVDFVEATGFSGSSAPVYNAGNRTITWTWSSAFATSFSSSAYVSVRYTSPTFSIGNLVCNTAYLFGEIPVLPLGTYSASNKSGNVCFNVETPTPGAACWGGGITAATAHWMNKHILAGTSCNWFSNGWYNSGNTELDSVTVIYNVDKSIDFSQIKVRPVYDGFDSVAPGSIEVYYQTNSNPYVYQGTYSSVTVAALSGSTQNVNITLPPGEYVTKVKFIVRGNLPIGGSQDFSYCGDSRTAALGAKDGTPIQEGSTYNPSNIGDDGTIVTNNSEGFYYFGGTSNAYSNCNGSAEIMIPQPVFGFTGKSIINSDGNYRASDTITYQFSTYLGGNVNATSVIITDTLDSRLNYVPGSSVLYIDNVPSSITPTITNDTILNWTLGTLTTGKTYAIRFQTVIEPGTPPTGIHNRAYLNSSNGLFNGVTDDVNVTVISAVALRAYKGQNGCDPSFVYYPTTAIAQEAGPVNYKITIKNLGNVAAKDLVMVDVFPFIGDFRSSQWFANLVSPVSISDPSSTVYYTTTSNPCLNDFNPATNPGGCSTPSWTTTPPMDITSVKAIKITRSAVLPALDSIELTWLMRAPVGTPINLLMNNSIMYQASRADNSSQLLPTTPIMVGMRTTCLPVLGSLGDYVWIDANKNGLQDEAASLGLNGMKVYLYGAGADNAIGGGDDVLMDSTVSAFDFYGNPGYYKFIELASGKYYVKFPTAFNEYLLSPVTNQTAQTNGNNDASLAGGLSGIVTINAAGAGQDKDNTTIDAGYYPLGSIGNYLWVDENKNGLQDESASNGINGLKVYLFRNMGAGMVLIDSTLTANDGSGNPGHYNFIIDESADYQVQFPLNYQTKVLTTRNTSPGVNGNSDASVTTGLSPVFTMNLVNNSGVNRHNPTIDAGYKCDVNTPVISGNTNICTGEQSTFSSTTGFNYTYQWYKDNVLIPGAISSNYIANTAGAYKIISTDSGACSSNASNTLTIPAVHIPPTANFTINNDNQCFGSHDFDFTNTSTSPGASVSYAWDFGDLTYSTDTNPSKTYGAEGSYHVKLIATNFYGCKDSITKSVYTGPPIANFSYTKNCDGTVTFHNLSSHANDYEWQFGNGFYCTNSTADITHPYGPGNYNVTLISRNNGLCADTITIPIHISPKLKAVFGIDSLGCTTVMQFNNYTDNADSLIWDFGVPLVTTDTSSANNPRFTYPADGTYTVTMIAITDENCTDTFTRVINVSSIGISPVANFTYAPLPGNCVTRFAFTNTSTNTSPLDDCYRWIFSDSSVIGIRDINKSFAVAGVYPVTLIARSTTNCYDTITQNVTVLANSGGPVVQFSPEDDEQCQFRNSFNFLNYSTFLGNGWTMNYHWDFGDGTQDLVNTFAFNKQYASAGTYQVRLVGFGSNGCRDTAYQTIKVLPSPQLNFTADAACGMRVEIVNNSTGALSHFWDFGDGFYEENNNDTLYHTYLTQGWKFINLSGVGNNGCPAEKNVGLMAAIGSMPQIHVTYDTIPCSNAIQFHNISINAGHYTWNFGDGSPVSYEFNPAHAYAVAGNYTVIVIGSNGGSCFDADTFVVAAPPGLGNPLPSARFNYTLSTCANIVQAVDISLNGAATNWFWDGVFMNWGPNFTISNPSIGGHTLTMVSINGACRDTFSRFIQIQDIPVGRMVFDTNSCNRNVVFTADALNSETYSWNFGDAGSGSNTSTGPMASHNFTANGDYIVSLTMTNNSGCSVTVQDTVTVNASVGSVNSSFYFRNTICNCVCSNKVQFFNTSSGTSNTYLWNFGDGNLSNQNSPNKGYADTGYFTVSLTAIDPSGCSSVSTAQVYVPSTAQGPSASFNTENPVQCLVGNSFNFTNTSQYLGAGWIPKYYWNFGDGTIDSTHSFIYNKHYASAGTYTVSLVAVGSENCYDTTTMIVQVIGGTCFGYARPIKVNFPHKDVLDFDKLKVDSKTSTGSTESLIQPQNAYVLYPNPNTGEFSIACKFLSRNTIVEVMDLLGRKVRVQIHMNLYENKIELVCSDLSVGNYLVVITDENVKPTHIRFNVSK
jgi:fimbrial isopeptide formation D2 family protein